MSDWPTIVKDNTPLVWQIAWRMLGNRADAADCFQEAFLSALKAARNGSVKSWPALLRHLATTRALDRLRQRYRNRVHAAAIEEWSIADPGPTDPAQRYEQQELSHQLRQAIAQLPAEQGEAFCLRFLDQLSNRQIARLMNTTPNNIAVLIHRARQQLQQILETIHSEYRS